MRDPANYLICARMVMTFQRQSTSPSIVIVRVFSKMLRNVDCQCQTHALQVSNNNVKLNLTIYNH